MSRLPLVKISPFGVSIALVVLCACSTHLASNAGEFDVREQPVRVGDNVVHATYVVPHNPSHSGYFVVLATGDGGWRGVSAELLEHLADRGYLVAGFSAPEALQQVKRSGERVAASSAADRLAAVFAQARRDLGVPEGGTMIAMGFSRGATMVAFAAVNPALRRGLGGAIAIALTRESDYLRAPDASERSPAIQVDSKDRIQIYPALSLIGSTPLAVIQSTGDRYVPAAEARRLLGPDTPTRRLYEVEAGGHTFGGGRDALLRDVDDALSWIERSSGAPARSASADSR